MKASIPIRPSVISMCRTPRRVTKAELIGALYLANKQLVAAQYGQLPGCMNHKPVIAEIGRVLGKAGHEGFVA